MAAHRQTRSTVYQQTFATAELLENIIVHLPARTILARMLGVSRFWNNVINASPAIQTKLWRRPLSDLVSSPVGLADFDDIFFQYGVETFESGMPIYSGSYEINSVFPGAPTQQPRYPNLSHIDIPEQPLDVSMELQDKQVVQVAITRDHPSEASCESPSWLDMHVSEPPITTARIEVFAETESTHLGATSDESGYMAPESAVTATQATLRDSGGVTFGMVRDVADKIVGSSNHPRLVRGEKLVTIRICFVADRAEISLPDMPGRD